MLRACRAPCDACAAFTWNNGNPHNLWKVRSVNDYNSCTLNSATGVLLRGGESGTGVDAYNYTVSEASGSKLYFACSVGNFHCQIGMQIAFTVK